ncbi:MAG: DEAD/DEAH box helicase family protein [Candidatus Izemoplasmatales bacterium]|nr:DEAD/DEAH box helicase family protein [Candidatus Izemoplasmatales bacterium]MDD4069805.1 DEAD/DEAH box helicase family protein [Candidatus Izemoplasmatales bacterium]
MINRKLYPEYTVDAINNMMSLRRPQKQSVQILDSILNEIELSKKIDLEKSSRLINDVYPIFKDFEHNFMSLAFALATGVGKTKLIGAFITYLYTNKGIRNFFVVAPNLTIYSKLKNDLGNPNPSNEKYVFKGVGCFATRTPNVWIDDDYRNRPLISTTDSDSVNIYIFNISKFNSEERNIMNLNEYLGTSFFEHLSELNDLVLIMDESHHYRAEASAAAIDSLNPVLGLELTATPQIQSGSKTILFKNVVYEYPLSKAIKDGYTRTPYALTRKDIKTQNFTEEQLDKTMINDGINHHENMKTELLEYSINHKEKLVKPFMLIVCKNTNHAEKILDYIQSAAFKEGKYADKVIMIHSNQKGSEKEENIQQLLDVEKSENKVEIVIHVNILKEGWDVNNLYTIVPLRTAASRTLREQTVGRGLRLPFGKRTGVAMIDSVTLTAHDKFDDLIAEAQKGDSIFNVEGIIYADFEKQKVITPVKISLFDTNEKRDLVLREAGFDHNDNSKVEMYNEVISSIAKQTLEKKKQTPNKIIKANDIIKDVESDLAHKFKEESEDLSHLLLVAFNMIGQETVEKAQSKNMYIPKIKTENLGEEKYIIQDFDLDLSDMVYVPIANDILIKNMLNTKEEVIIKKGAVIDFDTIKPEKTLVDGIRDISEIDYEKCPELIQKIVMQFLDHYRASFTETEVRNICLMYRKDIIQKFKNQLLQHLAISYEGIVEVVSGIETVIDNYVVDITAGLKDIHQEPKTGESIRSITYEGSTKSVTPKFKFDSDPERKFAISCDYSKEVIQWLRPAASQFNITYNRGKRYEPDFVVETEEGYYLVEVKSRREMSDPDVLAKKERAINYCRVASEYNIANGQKPFKYLFIPHDEVATNSSFNNLKDRFLSE